MDIRDHNRSAWDKNVADGDIWTVPASPAEVAAARRGEWSFSITGARPVPRDWVPALPGLQVLCLGGGGGQQGPILAAAGAVVTVFDNSPLQLEQDRRVAEREKLAITTIEGDMLDLSGFADEAFDLVVHPISNLFVPHVQPVWQGTYRLLRPGGSLLAGFMNPAFYIFDRDLLDDRGILSIRHPLPYSDLEHAGTRQLKRLIKKGWPLEWSHSLEDQLGGLLQAGFVIVGFYEERDPRNALYAVMPIHIGVRALKPARQE